jgi:hypothetical protein
MHLAITELASRDMETNHVAIDRLREIATHDVVLFTQMELDHVQQCVGCFEEWAVLIENIQTDLFE